MRASFDPYAFFKHKSAPEGMMYYTILDNATWHKKVLRLNVDERLPEYEDIRGQVEFLHAAIFPRSKPHRACVEKDTARENA